MGEIPTRAFRNVSTCRDVLLARRAGDVALRKRFVDTNDDAIIAERSAKINYRL